MSTGDPDMLFLRSFAYSIRSFGLAVTKSVSATARSTIDTCRTLGIWVVSLSLGWEKFQGLQILGFVLLVYGTFVFNGIMNLPFLSTKDGISHEPESYDSSVPGVLLHDEEDVPRSGRETGRPISRRSASSGPRRQGSEHTPLINDEE